MHLSLIYHKWYEFLLPVARAMKDSGERRWVQRPLQVVGAAVNMMGMAWGAVLASTGGERICYQQAKDNGYEEDEGAASTYLLSPKGTHYATED